MSEFLVTHAANDLDRVVLISADEATVSQTACARQSIKADNWVEARCKVNTAGIYHDEGFGWRSM